jgi:hypothetical protein
MEEKKAVNFTVIPDDPGLPRTYSNFCAIQHSPFDFTLTFCEMMPLTDAQFVPGQDHQMIKAPVKAKVVIPVQIIPGLVAALQENYRMYQEGYGPAKGPLH